MRMGFLAFLADIRLNKKIVVKCYNMNFRFAVNTLYHCIGLAHTRLAQINHIHVT